MPIGTYTWRDVHSRYLAALDYEHITLSGSEQKGFDVAKLMAAEFCFVQYLNGPIRALWFPEASNVLSDSEGFIFLHAATTTFNRLEMLYFLATLNTGATSGDILVHYYAPPTP